MHSTTVYCVRPVLAQILQLDSSPRVVHSADPIGERVRERCVVNMAMCEPQNTELSRTIEKDLWNQVGSKRSNYFD